VKNRKGIALCEALAAGVPIVATDVGGIPYVVDNNEDGFLMPYNDIDAFADAIIRLLSDDTLFISMSQKAASAGQRFDWDNITSQIINMYQLV
jgi:glycosyltransferase involved in cell wall biosynthesis